MGSSSTSSSSFDDILSGRQACDFRWASRPFYPSQPFVKGSKPPLEPKDILYQVLGSPRVQKVVKEVAEKEQQDEQNIVKRGQEILVEMGHDYRLYTIRWFAYVLSKLGRSHFSSIYVDKAKISRIKEGLSQYPVVILPTHRSYVDFLLLSYVCFTFDLPLPIIAAGMDFMGMLGVAELLRKAGAFFIRRRFGDDALYRTLLTEYVKKVILHGGHPLEMFLEGTRSRSGKSLYPKVGLLTALSELVRDREVPDILILPVSMSYDRTLEETLYARELLGQPKPKESTNGLLKGLRWLRSQRYGSMYVRFGDFISVREALGEVELSRPSPYTDEKIFTQRVTDIGLQVIMEQQRNLVTPLFPVVATVLLSHLSDGKGSNINIQELLRHIQNLQKLTHTEFGLPLREDTLEWNLRKILSVHEGIVHCPENKGDAIQILVSQDDKEKHIVEIMRLQHYANQFVPKIVPFSILSLLNGDGDMEEYSFLRKLLFDDFIYDVGTEVEEVTKALSLLNSFYARTRRNGHTVKSEDFEDTKKVLKSAIMPFLFSHWGIGKTLLQTPSSFSESKQLSKLAQSNLRQLLEDSRFPPHYGALSLDSLGNAAMSLLKLGYCQKKKDMGNSNGSFLIGAKDERGLRDAVERIERYLPLNNSSSQEEASQQARLKSKL